MEQVGEDASETAPGRRAWIPVFFVNPSRGSFPSESTGGLFRFFVQSDGDDPCHEHHLQEQRAGQGAAAADADGGEWPRD